MLTIRLNSLPQAKISSEPPDQAFGDGDRWWTLPHLEFAVSHSGYEGMERCRGSQTTSAYLFPIRESDHKRHADRPVWHQERCRAEHHRRWRAKAGAVG